MSSLECLSERLAMTIEVKQGVLARKLSKEFKDEGFAPLNAGTYEIAGAIENGYLPIRVTESKIVHIPLDKLQEYVKQNLVVINPSERH